jgi:hypothetical protein
MYVSGTSYVQELADGARSCVKMVFNANGAIFFPDSEQHRDQKANGISYEDDYAGNALAALLSTGAVEVRFHRNFTDVRVLSLLQSLAMHPELSVLREWRITYQGRDLQHKD